MMNAILQPAFFGGFGGPEIIVVFVVVLILFGPKRLPEIAKMFGKTAETLRKSAQDFKSEVMKIEHEEPAKYTSKMEDTPSMEQQGYIDVDGVAGNPPSDSEVPALGPGETAVSPESQDPAEEQEMADASVRASEDVNPAVTDTPDQPGAETENKTDDRAG